MARAIARYTAPAPEAIARVLTWGADEKVLLVLAMAGWIASRGRSEPLRRAGNHALLVTVAATLLPHSLKLLASDVVAGFALGAILERLLRLWTGYPLALISKTTGKFRLPPSPSSAE